MTLQQMRYFMEAATTLHFTRAAENLYVAQSSLSHAILALEDELGAPLFVRRNYKQIALTNYGKTFLPYVIRVLDEVDKGKTAVEQMIMPNSGVVNLSYTFTNGHHMTQNLLGNFYSYKKNSNISISLHVNHGKIAFDEELEKGATDLVISCYCPDEPTIGFQKIGRQDLFIMVGKDHPLASREVLTLEEIKHEKIIMFTTSLSLHKWVTKMFESSKITPCYIEGLSDWTTQLLQVAANKGVAILPHLPVEMESVREIRIDHPMNSRDVVMLWANRRTLTPAVKYVRDYAIDYFEKNAVQ